jgi:soluble lytic murein transglycosylase-like protein
VTTHPLSAVPNFGGRVRPPHAGRSHAILIALLALLALALIPVSAPSRAVATATVPSLNDSARPGPALDAVRTSLAPHRAGATNSRDIEALTTAVARKYRISQDATRELVSAAYREGARDGLDPLLILAVMAVESRFNPIAASDGGAVGLMQVIPRYHADKFDASIGESALDPHTNISIGARALKEYIRRGGSPIAGLQLYNGAPGDASSAYAYRVLAEMRSLQDALRRTGNPA